MPAGRPSKLTTEIKDKLDYAFSIGCNNAEACVYADLSESTFYSWIEKDEKLSERFKALKNKPVLKAKEVVQSALDEGDSNTAKWYLERRSAEFKPSSKTEIEGKVGVSHSWTIQPVKPKE